MEAILLESDGESVPDWMVGLADELVEDPRCRLVLMGSDQNGVVLVTIWDAEMVGEVAAGLSERTADGVRLRRLALVDPSNPAGMA